MNYSKKTGFNLYQSRHCAYLTYSVKTWFLKILYVLNDCYRKNEQKISMFVGFSDRYCGLEHIIHSLPKNYDMELYVIFIYFEYNVFPRNICRNRNVIKTRGSYKKQR